MVEQVPEVSVDVFAGTWRRATRLVDVREPEEFDSGHVPGAVNVPLGEVLAAPQSFAEQECYVICHSGGRSAKAAGAINAAGGRAVSVSGGTAGWIEAGHPVERSARQ
ncbi:rhodanese-like domain-containing protein [Saccharopolyspora rhizosphaerae]|uniref:Rhodanese-like domain-containing protein n=1 Tax=Saccharopolyspora rhizosphaerae TaxID=2492662 RepID=A0A426K129_9PSEU|nr:rhodanese-like domain-containing protein [Saccharopolyspora rhizosphaerae]RRO19237.1 rhodanese-like domain-containing protein [Saccharopolyspora rhizosphaerae]